MLHAFRCVFDMNNGAPFIIQIGCIVVICLITFAGISIGMGGIAGTGGRVGSRYPWLYLLIGFGAFLFFMWWSSPIEMCWGENNG